MIRLIVGLGNPGIVYKNNKHNLGFKIIDSLSKKANIILDKEQFHGVYGAFMLNDEKIIIAKPLTYMNKSGDFVFQFVNYYNIAIEDIVIIYDDIDVKFGEYKLKTSGSSGGQKGMEDIIRKLGTSCIKRIRVGIGPKNPKMDLVNYVLSNFSKEEQPTLTRIINNVTKICLNINIAEFSNLEYHILRKK